MKDKVIYKELSYKIVGILFEVFNELGYGYHEKYYERAIGKGLTNERIKYKTQVPCKITFKGEKIGSYFLDFLIDDKIVLELKIGKPYSKKNYDQVKAYLHATNKQLAVLATFTPKGVIFLRLLNINNRFEKTEAELNLIKVRKLINL